ncbi:MAG: FtsH protease activity modulator HflK [Proteobacteria bacterium]|nr:FtsH protease activity modulator HflK [Pseudomonadota bacterium]
MDRQDNFPFPGQAAGRSELEELKRIYKNNSGTIGIVIILVILALVLYSAAYTVETDAVGVVTRFGKYRTTTNPGWHFKLPMVDDVQKVRTKRQLKLEFGFRTESAGIKSTFRRNSQLRRESIMLTGDLNVAVVEWIVHYKIADPYQYLFKVRNVVKPVTGKGTLRDLSEATMRAVVGDYSVTEVLTTGREEILEKVRVLLADLCQEYETGIAIQRIELKDSAPPEQVKPSFNEVNEAEQERDRLQNEAWARYNKAIPNARGEAKQMIQEAEGYAVERVNEAQGDVAKFVAIQKEYARAPEVTRSRLYLETMNEVLPKAGKKVFMDKELKGVMPLLFPADGSAATTGGAR